MGHRQPAGYCPRLTVIQLLFKQSFEFKSKDPEKSRSMLLSPIKKSLQQAFFNAARMRHPAHLMDYFFFPT
ncbi:hypothetical protein [Castellaniella sp.]|uniref:hypothetical protein n=1 Tax=Castellaniella sp. TaxID=1955812 RepID=UPI002AFF99CA|nr:hypothetical protein [Castellaniella sp.]